MMDKIVSDCLEANAHYNKLMEWHWSFSRRNTLMVTSCAEMADAFLSYAENLTKS